jgi:16S rRNA (adenine1518-N6/adenine1519-N6)-dimethyltransferase
MTFSGHRARHRFGQHWLIDANVLDQIVAAAELQPHDRVLEVGPGRGALTERLLAWDLEALEAIELDRDLVAGLRQRFGPDPRFQLVEGDALRVPIERQGPKASTKVVANIPYNITGPLLQRLVGSLEAPLTPPFERLVLLVQREVGERIRAQAGTSAYGALSVRMQLLGHCRLVCPVPPRCFKPPPKVDSEVLLIEPFAPGNRLAAAGAGVLDSLLRRCFASRRKMLRNTLAGLLPPEQLQSVAVVAGVDLAARPQELSPSRWLALAAGLNPAIPAAAFAPPANG